MNKVASASLVRKLSSQKLLKLGLLLYLFLILMFPAASFKGARSGLLLWWDTLLPTLLPFMILSGLIIRLRVTRVISIFLYPILKHILPVSKDGCYPVFIGYLAGLPVGAKVTADLYAQKAISCTEAQFICALSNNSSPMFILSYIAGIKLASPSCGVALLLIIYLSSLFSALTWYHLFGKHAKDSEDCVFASSNDVFKPNRFHFSMLDDSILSAFEVVTKVGGYILLFSVLASLLSLIPISASPLNECFTSLLEITTGISAVSALNLTLGTKIVLVSTATAFGGLCAIAQTKSVVAETDISMTAYLFTKLLSALIAFILSLIYVTFIL